MGALATWGAVAGGAEGVKENIDRGLKEEAASIDAAREERLAKMKHDQELALEEKKQEGRVAITGMEQSGATGRTGMQVGGNVAVQEIRGDQALEEQTAEQEWKSIESELDRTRDVQVAKIRASATAAGSSSQYKRFEAKTLKSGEQQLDADGNPIPGLTVEKDTPAIYDRDEGAWYVAHGDKLLLPGTSPEELQKFPRPDVKATDFLLKNPGYASQFVSKFGYLPRELLVAKRLSDMGGQEPSP